MLPNLSRLLENQRLHDQSVQRHLLFDLRNEQDRSELQKLLLGNKEIRVIDQIETQIRDLIKLENPSISFTIEEYSKAVKKRLGDFASEDFGVWVYYPWKQLVVHVLDEADFVRVRTIRNAFKITLEEQQKLRKKRIGVIGLSVGQSAAINAAIESIAGEIRLADFDTLELSNLNRIRSPLANIGLPKTEIVYREIVEIDPFIKVAIFSEGINPNNIKDFLTEEGTLDLLIEECDSVEIKILARIEARSHRIPVIMDTSDRGMLDIERYDLNPDYPILHGLVGKHLTYEFLSKLRSSEEKLPYILPILGIETISMRLKASGMEVGKSITTWPQLGSEVSLGGALCANVGRRILLGEKLQSGRFWIDLDQLFNVEETENESKFEFEDSLSEKEVLRLSESVELIEGLELDNENLEKILKAATAAPSAGNNQKWRWHWRSHNLILFVDKNKQYAYSDNLNIASLIGIGCCIENIVLCSSQLNLTANIRLCDKELFPAVAVVSFSDVSNINKNANLSDYIFERLTTRSNDVNYEGPRSSYEMFNNLIEEEGMALQFIFDKDKIKKIGELVCIGDRIRFTNLQGHQEFFQKELRWDEDHSLKNRDGLDITLFDLNPLDITGLNLAKDIDVIRFLNSINGGAGFERISSRNFHNADSIGFVFTNDYEQSSLIEAGRVIERIWLKATEMRMGIFPMTVLPMLCSFVEDDHHKFNSHTSIQELQDIKDQLDSIFEIPSKMKMVFMFKTTGVDPSTRRSVRHSHQEKLIVS